MWENFNEIFTPKFFLWNFTSLSICHRQRQLTDTVCLPNKLAIFQISSAQYPIRARLAVVYFTTQYSNYLSTAAGNRPKYAVFVPLSPASTEFRKIPQKQANSAARLKILHSMENRGPFLWIPGCQQWLQTASCPIILGLVFLPHDTLTIHSGEIRMFSCGSYAKVTGR